VLFIQSLFVKNKTSFLLAFLRGVSFLVGFFYLLKATATSSTTNRRAIDKHLPLAVHNLDSAVFKFMFFPSKTANIFQFNSFYRRTVMKLSHILPLVVVSAAAGVLATTSPADALTWNLNNVTFTDGATATGSFDYNAGSFSNVNITVQQGASTFATFNTGNVVTVDGGGNESSASNLWVKYPGFGAQEVRFSISGSFADTLTPTFNLVANGLWGPGDTYYGLSEFQRIGLASGSVTTNAVPFDIPGGATIPSVGALLALGAMRKARKSIASKTRLANSVCASVS
jgi:hypothetical protein